MSNSASAPAVLPSDHWFHRFISGEDSMYGRNKNYVQPAAIALALSGRPISRDIGEETPDGWFLERTERLSSLRFKDSTLEEKKRGWVDVPIAWKLLDLWYAVHEYTNSERPTGFGRRYDPVFSFQIKSLRPEWDCHRSLHQVRESHLDWIEMNTGDLEWKPRGLARWERLLKAKEAELFRVAHKLDRSDVETALDRLMFQDGELHRYIHHVGFLGFCDAADRRVVPDEAAREALYEAVRTIDRRHGIHDKEGFTDYWLLVYDAYDELNSAFRRGQMKMPEWNAADEALQAALRLEPHGDLPAGRLSYCTALLDIAGQIKAGADVPKLIESCRKYRSVAASQGGSAHDRR